MKILVTGCAGFIGSNMSVEAISRGHSVVAFDNLWRPNVSDNVRYMEQTYKDKYKFVWGDIRNPEDFNVLKDVDAVIALAANPGAITSVLHPIYDFRSNAMGTFNTLEFARARKIPVIYASTTKTMSDIVNTFPMKETDTRYELTEGEYPDVVRAGLTMGEGGIPEAINDKFPIDGFGKYGHSPYGISKLTGELYAQEFHVTFGLPVVIFRMSCIYGIFQKGIEEQGWVSFFLKQILNGDGKINIFGNGKQVRDILDGRDVARAYLNALENLDKSNGEVFTIGGGTKYNFSLLEVITKIEEVTGKKAELTFKDKRPADQDWFVLCNKKCKELLNWEPTIGLDQALQDMMNQ